MPRRPAAEVFTVATDLFGELTVPAAAADEVAALTAYARDVAGRARAPATRRAYRSHWQGYLAYCDSLGLVPLGGDPRVVGLYLAALARDGKRLSTIRAHLAAISAAHRLAGVALNLRAPAVAAVLDGLKRDLGVRPLRQAQALLAAELPAFLGAFPGDEPRARRNRALALIGFGAALRRSELVALDVGDLTLTADGLEIDLRRSKTDPGGAGAVLAIWRATDPALCASRAVEAWLEVRGRHPGALFTRVRKGGRVGGERLSDKAVWRLVREAGEALGWDTDRLSPHSLRAGLATSAALQGAPLDEIMEQTRHRSYAVARTYVRKADAWKRNVTQRLFAADPEPDGT